MALFCSLPFEIQSLIFEYGACLDHGVDVLWDHVVSYILLLGELL